MRPPQPQTSETWFGNIFRINKQLRDIFCMNRYTYEPILVTAHVDIQLLIGKFLQTAPSKLMHPLINPQIEFNFGESLHFLKIGEFPANAYGVHKMYYCAQKCSSPFTKLVSASVKLVWVMQNLFWFCKHRCGFLLPGYGHTNQHIFTKVARVKFLNIH